MKYDFPGNVRELENIIESAVVLSRHEYITLSDLPLSLQSLSPKNSLLDPTNLDNSYHDKMKAFESTLITAALMQTNYNKSAAARLIGISERHLRSRIEKLGLKNLPKAQ